MALEHPQAQSEQALQAALSWEVVDAMPPTNCPRRLP